MSPLEGQRNGGLHLDEVPSRRWGPGGQGGGPAGLEPAKVKHHIASDIYRRMQTDCRSEFGGSR
jgi:hypothetical protein